MVQPEPLPSAPFAEDAIDPSVWFEANAEAWLDAIVGFTPRTTTLDLTTADCRALLGACKAGDAAAAALGPLEARLEGAIAAFVDLAGAAFVKTSCRSPKDATVADGRIRAIFDEAVAAGRASTPDAALVALYTASLQALRVTTAREALALLVSSGRVEQDLELAVAAVASAGGGGVCMALLVREFLPGLHVEQEFRGIVFGGSLNAVTQYFGEIFFERLQDGRVRGAILAAIVALFERVRGLIPLQNYIVDFAVDEAGVATILELNPYAPSTTACLYYAWTKDRALFEAGPLRDIRINSVRTTPGKLKHAVLREWTPFVEHFWA